MTASAISARAIVAAAVTMHGANGVFQKRRDGHFEADFVTSGCGWTEAEAMRTAPDAVALLLPIEYRHPFRPYELGKVLAEIPSSNLDGVALSYQSLDGIGSVGEFVRVLECNPIVRIVNGAELAQAVVAEVQLTFDCDDRESPRPPLAIGRFALFVVRWWRNGHRSVSEKRKSSIRLSSAQPFLHLSASS